MLADSQYTVREDLRDALDRVWARVGQPGAFWSSAERVDIAAEVRHARGCDFCATCREAVSPFAPEGDHESVTLLPSAVVDVVHRLVTDQGRLTRSWYEGVIESGVSIGQYVETVGFVATVTAVDTMCRGLGVDAPELPEPEASEPSGEYSEDAAVTMAWVPTVSPKRTEGVLKEFWFPGGAERYVPRVAQALSYVPAETMGFQDVMSAFYIGNPVADYTTSDRAISRAHMELLAARTSAHNECFY